MTTRATTPSTRSVTSRATSTSTSETAPEDRRVFAAAPAAPKTAGTTDRLTELRGVLSTFSAVLKRALDEIPLTAQAPPAGLILDALHCRQLDDLLGLGSTLTGERLVLAVEKLGSIKVGDIRIPFTPGQLAELQHRAMKRGHTVEAEMKAVVARLEEELFYKGG